MSIEDYNVSEKEFDIGFYFEKIIYKSNNKYLGIAISDLKTYIRFYNFEKIENIEEYFELKINFTLFELNQKYQYVLLISRNNCIESYELPNNFDKSVIKLNPKIQYKNDEIITQIIFNPKYSHIVAFLTEKTLYIGDNKKFYNFNNYNYKNHIFKLKWEKKGNICGFLHAPKNIKIFDRKEKREIFDYIIKKNEHFEFDFWNEDYLIITENKKNNIKIISIRNKNEQAKFIICNFKIKELLRTDNYLIIKSKYYIHFYDNDLKLIRNIKVSFNISKSIIVSNDKDEFKVITFGEGNSLELIFISDVIYESKKYEDISNKIMEEENEKKDEVILYDEEDDLNENYFIGCLSDLTNVVAFLKNDNNESNSLPEITNKKYLKIDEIKESLKNQSKSLIDLKNYVEKVIRTKPKFSNYEEEYKFYVKLLIKDDTNKILLKEYLKFLKNIEENNIDIKNPHENFKDELNYYLPLFDKNELIEFNYKTFISEKIKVEELLQNIKDNIEKGTFIKFRENLEDDDFIYYQPFPLNSPEIIFRRIKIGIIEDIKKFKFNESNEKQRLNYLNHIIVKILDNKILEKVQDPKKLIPLFNFMNENEEIEIFDFFFNLINEEKKDLKTNKCNENAKLNENLSKKYDESELYNYDYLMEHPPLRIDINKIKIFLKEVLGSNVFRQLFFFLTGRNDYEEIFNNNMINYIIDNINFMPINYTNTSAFFDKLTFTTYIPTMKKTLCITAQNVDEKIYQVLENGVIIEIEFHEYGHLISTIFSFLNKSQSLIATPRKKNFDINEGGYYIEMALFGKIIKTLTYEEALYILNIDNYKKSLDEFRTGFRIRKDDDLIINGPFEDLNVKQKNLENTSDNGEKRNVFSISTKPGIAEVSNFQIIIPLKKDIKGRDFPIEEILYYTKFHDEINNN